MVSITPTYEHSESTYLATADYTLVLVVTKTALVADSDESRWAHIGIADWTFSVALVAETSDGNT